MGSLTAQNQFLPAVEPLPLPQLPEWIEQISPTAEANNLAQIRIRFKEPLIPVESLDGDDRNAALQQFEITPALPGRFRFLTPRMVGFQADEALPQATRVRVTLKAGLSDLKNHRLDRDIAWTFNTPAIQLSGLPGVTLETTEVPPIDLQPTLEVTSNAELDINSLNEHARLVVEGRQQKVSLKAALKADENTESTPEQQFSPDNRPWVYTLEPTRSLQKATDYRLEFSPGLRPAHGNLVSETPFVSKLKTYAPLEFTGIQYVSQPEGGGAYGRFVKGNALLKFNNGLVAETVRNNIKIEPAPRTSPTPIQVYDEAPEVVLNPWSLEPNTSYTITIGKEIKDKFGQTLSEPITVNYETGDVAADLWAPEGLNIFPASKNLQLNITAVNLPDSSYKAAYKVIQPADLVYIDSAYPTGEGNDLLPKPDTWNSFAIASQKPNDTTEIAVPLRQQLGGQTGMLAYGVQARTYQYQQEGRSLWREPSFYGMVQLTNLGVFAQWFPESGMVRVHHLDDGSPAVARVEIYESKLGQKRSGTPRPCASGTTDAAGMLLLNQANLQGCMKGSAGGFVEPPPLLTVVREGNDWAYIRTQEWSGSYDYGIYTGWESTRPVSRGTIFSDRQLYQLGESAWLTGVAYYLQNGELKRDRNVAYTLTLTDANGTEKSLGSQTTNEFGTFSLEVPIAASQPLGTYTIRAKSENGVEFSGEFRVAEFKPPNFKVDLTLDKEFAFVEDTITANAQSNYLFGPAVQSGKVEYFATRRRTSFVPKNWDEFSFGRQWFWPEEEPEVPTDVMQQISQLDPTGKGSQTLKIADDLPYAMDYRIDAQVTDVSNLAVSSSKTVTALPSDRLIGLKHNFVATAGQPFNVQVIVTDPQGNAIAGQSVNLELQQMIYSSVTRVVEGSQQAKDQVEYKTVATGQARSGNTAQTVALTPTESGSYRIRATPGNRRDERAATDTQVWVTGANVVNWGDRFTNERVEVQLDKKTYRPGEMATALIQSPYPEAELYFAIVRHDTMLRKVIPVQGGAPQVQFQVTPEMLPNAAVEAVLVRRGKPLQQDETVQDLVRIGFSPFRVDVSDRYLTVTPTVQSATLQPKQEQTINLELKNAQGQPVQGQFTVMVVNEAVRQLTDYRPPDLVKTVYAERAISTRFGDNRPEVVLTNQASPLDKGWGYGGGMSAGAGGDRVRTDFKPLAYYNGSVLSDANGRATVQFALPDDLTTWRVMVVATDNQMQFGSADTTFITTKPLVTNPVLPQFARPGDRLEAGLSVTNTTNQAGNVTINGAIAGAVQPENNASLTMQTQSVGGTAAYRFPVVATTPGVADVQFSTQLNGNSDAFKVPLQVKPYSVTEQVIESGSTTNQAQIPLKIDNTVATDTGGLELNLASTIIPQLQAPAKQILDEEQLPFLEPAASQLAIAADLQLLSRTYGQTFGSFRPQEQATKAIERLEKLQRPDGGFSAYPKQEQSDPFVSPYAAQSLAMAKAAGLAGDNAMVTRLQSYLSKVLADPGQYDFCKPQECKDQVRLGALAGLHALGDRRTDFLSDLYDRHKSLDTFSQLRLARLLSDLPDWQDEANTLVAQLQETIYETGRTASLPASWNWLGSSTATQSEALRLFVTRSNQTGSIDRLAQSLLDQRRNGDWGSTYSNAVALTALVEYSQLQPAPPDFTAIAQLGNKTLTTAQFRGYAKPSETVSVPMADLPRGNQTLTIRKNGAGKLHYLAAYRYRLQGNPPGRFNGLRVTRIIHPANKPDVLQQMGLAENTQSFDVSPGQVFDIELEIVTDHPVNHVVLTDPLPAGFEAVDASFQTSTPYYEARHDSWQIGYQTIHSDRVVAYADRLEPGVYTLHYLVRSVTPGTFSYPGAEVHLQYAPEEFGRSAASTLKVAG